MKKLSLVLALVLVLTCGVLAACGGDENTSSAASSDAATSSTATSSEASSEAASSEASSEAASSEASSEAVSSEATSSEAVESSDAPAAEITGENIASTATYELSQLYRQGGAEVEWGWDETKDIAYPDSGNEMTDGVFAAGVDFTEAAWIGFHGKAPDYATNQYHSITFDLGAAKDITGVKVYVGTGDLGGGIVAPSNIEVFVSADKTEWTSIGSAVPANVTTEAGTATELVEIAGAGNGQYVQIRIVTGEAWGFVSEVEIFA